MHESAPEAVDRAPEHVGQEPGSAPPVEESAIQLLPHMPEAEIAWLEGRMIQSEGYVEFGSGGSTCLAAKHVRGYVFSVESSTEWLERLQEDVRVRRRTADGSLRVHHSDIGPTGMYGHPLGVVTKRMGLTYAFDPLLTLDEAPRQAADLVLIDGRFRVACALSAILLLRGTARIVFDDYSDRPFYHVVESVAGPPEMIGRAAVFCGDGADLQRCVELLPAFLDDPR